MPVADVPRVDTHTGNGVTTSFAYGYRIFADADLTVTVDGVLQTLITDYTVNGAGDDSGGSIDFITAPINLSVVTLSGELAYDRQTDYIENGPNLAQTKDNDFDRTIMLIQQNRRDINRSIKVPIEETTDQEVSLTPANRANKVLAFDGAGLPTASSLADLESILTTVDTSLALSGGILSVAIPNRQAVAGGTVDVITATFVPTIPALVNNIEVMVEASGANTTTTPTFAPDGLTAKTIVKGNNLALIVGDIPGADYRMHLVFDATLDKWVLLNPYHAAEIQAGGLVYIADTGAADVYVATLAPPVPAYTDGMEVRVKIVNANATTTPTLNVNGLGAKTIKQGNSAALVAGDLPVNHQATFRYDGTDFILLNPALHDHTSAGQGGKLTGMAIQVVHTQTGAVATGSTTIPLDDTIPQNTEGDEYMTLAITPTNTNNKLLIEVILNLTANANVQKIMALFQDSTADALAVSITDHSASATSSQNMITLSMRFEMTAGTTSAAIFKIRAGCATAGTITVNGHSGTSRMFGGVLLSSIRITEVQV